MSLEKNKEFFDLLENVAQQQALRILSLEGQEVTYKVLTTAQLKAIIQTVVDDSSAQLNFHSAVYEIMKQNVQQPFKPIETFNIVDKLFFIIENRIKAVSPTLFIRGDEDDSFVPVDLGAVQSKLKELVLTKKAQLQDRTVGDETISLTVGIPLIETEKLVNEAVYDKLNVEAENSQLIEEVLGTAFLLEICKWIKEISVLGQTLTLQDLSLEERIEAIKRIPASNIEKAIDYIETTKQEIDACLTVSDKLLPLNGTLFSVR